MENESTNETANVEQEQEQEQEQTEQTTPSISALVERMAALDPGDEAELTQDAIDAVRTAVKAATGELNASLEATGRATNEWGRVRAIAETLFPNGTPLGRVATWLNARVVAFAGRIEAGTGVVDWGKHKSETDDGKGQRQNPTATVARDAVAFVLSLCASLETRKTAQHARRRLKDVSAELDREKAKTDAMARRMDRMQELTALLVKGEIDAVEFANASTEADIEYSTRLAEIETPASEEQGDALQ